MDEIEKRNEAYNKMRKNEINDLYKTLRQDSFSYDKKRYIQRYRDVVELCYSSINKGKESINFPKIVKLVKILLNDMGDNTPNYLEEFIEYCSINEKQDVFARAENYKDITKAKIVRDRLINIITDYIDDPENKPLFLVGPRGRGKTFITLKVLSTKTDYQPIFRIFKKNNQIETLDNRIIGMDSHKGEDKPKIYVFDDIHYIFEAAIKNEIEIDKLLSYLKEIKKSINKKEPVILLSDALMVTYAEKLKNKELFDFLPEVGEISHKYFNDQIKELRKNKDSMEKIKEYIINQRERKNIMVRYEYPKVEKTELMKIAYNNGRKFDEKTWAFIENNRRMTPRGIINFMNEFKDEPYVDYELVTKRAKHIIQNSTLNGSQRIIYLNTINAQDEIFNCLSENALKALLIFGSYKKLEKYVEKWERKKDEIFSRIKEETEMIQSASDLNVDFEYDDLSVIDEYIKLTKTLKKEKKMYTGDTTFLIGWKGHFTETLNDISKNANLKENQHLWESIAKFKMTKMGPMPIAMLDKIFNHCFNEGSYLEEMLEYVKDAKKQLKEE
jgi:hypothetical protein